MNLHPEHFGAWRELIVIAHQLQRVCCAWHLQQHLLNRGATAVKQAIESLPCLPRIRWPPLRLSLHHLSQPTGSTQYVSQTLRAYRGDRREREETCFDSNERRRIWWQIGLACHRNRSLNPLQGGVELHAAFFLIQTSRFLKLRFELSPKCVVVPTERLLPRAPRRGRFRFGNQQQRAKCEESNHPTNKPTATSFAFDLNQSCHAAMLRGNVRVSSDACCILRVAFYSALGLIELR